MDMDIFSVLAVPTRRNILEVIVKNGQLPASDIYSHFSVSPQAISQHLKILREANLVTVEKQGQKRLYTLNQKELLILGDWVQMMAEKWNERFSALDTLLAKEKNKLN